MYDIKVDTKTGFCNNAPEAKINLIYGILKTELHVSSKIKS